MSKFQAAGPGCDVYVSPDWHYAGDYHYVVFVDGEKYDEFTSRRPWGWLTQSQMYDIANGYQEAIDSIRAGMLESYQTTD